MRTGPVAAVIRAGVSCDLNIPSTPCDRRRVVIYAQVMRESAAVTQIKENYMTSIDMGTPGSDIALNSDID